jgi:beta-galactosidase
VDGGTVKSVVDVTGSKGCGFTHTCEFIFGDDGSVTMKNKVVPYGALPALPRLGLSMRLAKSLENVRWYGRGPHENYIDRATSAFFGVWASDVNGLFTEYARPQDNGCRTGARWVEFTDAGGAGVRFVQSEPISFQALKYGWEELYFARHQNGEPRRNAPLVPEDATLLNIDIRQTGLGGGSCGPGPLDQYRFDAAATVEWTLRLSPPVDVSVK